MSGLLRRIVPDVIRRSYALKFAIALLILGLSVGAIGIVGTTQIQDGVQSNVHSDHETTALQQAQSIDKIHQENLRTVESFSRTGSLGDGPEEAQDYIEEEMEARDAGGQREPHLHLVSLDGTVIASTMLGQEPDEELPGEWTNSIESGLYVTDVYQTGEADGNTDRVAYVTDTGGVPDGAVLVYSVPLSEYDVTSADGTYTMVVDGSNTIALGEPGDEDFAASTSPVLEEYTDDTTPIETARNLSADTAGVTEATPQGGILSDEDFFGQQEYVVGYAPVSTADDWVVLVHTSTEQAYGFVDDVQFYGTIATAVAVLLIVGVGAVIGWNTSRSIDRLTQKASRMEEGDLDVELDSPRIDSIGRLYDGFDSMRDSLKTQITETEQARQEAEEARAEAERLNDHLEAKADEYSEVMQATADGDLTARMDPESENEAMSDIANEFNEMIAELEETTASVKSFATEVATASEEVTASSEEVHSASGQVARSTQEISEGADQQSDSLQSINREMNGLSTTIEEIAASSNQVAELAERTAQTGERGREAAQEAIEGMQEIEAESESAVEEIERLEDEMAQIDELLEFITEVAEQTNMLALNANIEASRSESSNEGFSAVAGEVKDLAEETREAAADIEDRLEQIKSQTDRTADEVQRTSDRVSEHTDSVERAADALDEIADYAVETNTGIQEISNASDEQAASTQEVVAMVDEVAAIAQQTSTESETVAAAAEEQTTALTEVSRSASELAGRAAHLSETLDHFDTDVDGDIDVDAAVPEPEFETDVALEADAADGELFDGDLGGESDSTSDAGTDEASGSIDAGTGVETDAESADETDAGSDVVSFDERDVGDADAEPGAVTDEGEDDGADGSADADADDAETDDGDDEDDPLASSFQFEQPDDDS